MDVRVENVNTTVRMVEAEALLSPEVLRQVVAAVKEALDAEQALREEQQSDMDTLISGARRW